MIVDKLENAGLYAGISEKIAKALDVLKDKGLAQKEDGRYDIDGDEMYYLVLRYQSKHVKEEKLKFEAHKKYIDVQFVLSGEEMLGYAPTDLLEIETPYVEDGDYAFYNVPANFTPVNLSAGLFAILFPQDAHMPCCQLDGPKDILKVVVKVKIDVE